MSITQTIYSDAMDVALDNDNNNAGNGDNNNAGNGDNNNAANDNTTANNSPCAHIGMVI